MQWQISPPPDIYAASIPPKAHGPSRQPPQCRRFWPTTALLPWLYFVTLFSISIERNITTKQHLLLLLHRYPSVRKQKRRHPDSIQLPSRKSFFPSEYTRLLLCSLQLIILLRKCSPVGYCALLSLPAAAAPLWL